MNINSRTKKQAPGVAVLGGGIAGIQCALDLATSGFKVYLIERDISIGGNMARLDKTFPTNDCSTCMLSPKLLEVASKQNVEILTRTEVLDVKGEPGNFILKIRKHPRFVNEDLCTSCGECEKVCPIDIPSTFNMNLSSKKAIFKHFPQAIPSAYAIEKAGIAPCRSACPAGISVEGYVALIRKGLFREALKLVKRDNPFAAVCGRICHHPCEKACYRGHQDEPIAIEALKRFIADLDLLSEDPYIPERKPLKEKKVAIIGAGPAGLTAAYYLAIEGYQVTVFDAMKKPGGLLEYGIPAFRLPKDIVQKEISLIEALGVKINTGKVWGQDFTIRQLKEQGYDAILIATGTPKPLMQNVPGENLNGVIPAIEFLKNFHTGKKVSVGEKVVVIGGGNVAFDAARTVVRLGTTKKVTILYRRSERELPASREEFQNALEEGIEVKFLTGCVEILGKEKVEGIKAIKMELGPADESGRRRPIPVEGGYFNIDADTVIVAIGQRTDTSPLEKEPPELRPALSKWGTIIVDPITFETSIPGLFAAGDIVLAPSTVVQAVGTAKEAAISIKRYLEGSDLKAGRKRNLAIAEKPYLTLPDEPRLKQKKIPLSERLKSFNEVTLGFNEEEAIREASRCLECGICSECYRCVDACAVGAVDHDMNEVEEELNVAGIIVATGFKPFDPRLRPEYGYGRYPNVITSLEFERILSASGPSEGHLVRPSDGKQPKKIAWIQCVGSRDVSLDREYCSSVCCMYATKQAIITKEHHRETEAFIFFIDFRSMGKGFERYYERAKNQYGVNYIRCNISRVVETPEHDLEITYLDSDGTLRNELFDLVVLSVGLEPTEEIAKLSQALKLNVDKYGFISTDPLSPTTSLKPGIMVCGTAENPKDIPDSVVQASSAVASIQLICPEVSNTPDLKETHEKPIREYQPPRIGVFVCHCGINIAGVVDVHEVVKYAAKLPVVKHAENLLFACATDGTNKIKEAIKKHRLNRVVVASCSPRTHEPLFQNALEQAGLNRYLLEMANIRDQCSWVHGNTPVKATQKAKDLVRMAVAKAYFLDPLEEIKIPIVQRVLIVGGGPSGMTAALCLANQGLPVTLVEKEKELGGIASRWLNQHYSGESIKNKVDHLIKEVTDHPNIELHLSSLVTSFEGHPGHFISTIKNTQKESTTTVQYGSLIIATGAVEYQGKEFLRGKSDKVITQLEFHKMLSSDDSRRLKQVKNIVMIQCIGSRNLENQYCSRICCTSAIANAIAFKAKYPSANVAILYRDIRTFGKRELLYLKARRIGIRFFRYDPDVDYYPEVQEEGGKIIVSFVDKTLDKEIELDADLLVLSTGVMAPEENQKLAKLFKLSLDQDNFFMEAHIKLRPVETATTGVYLAGTAQGPKFFDECIDQARAAASKASTFLKQQYLRTGGRIAVVNPSKCSVCLTCVRVCPYGAPSISGEFNASAKIDPAICQGCGICVSECPARAIELQCFTTEQLKSKICAMFETDFLNEEATKLALGA